MTFCHAGLVHSCFEFSKFPPQTMAVIDEYMKEKYETAVLESIINISVN